MQQNLPFTREFNPKCPDQCKLRGMTAEKRKDYFISFARHLFGGMWHIKLDGNLAATGYEDDFPGMLDRFNEFVDGPDRPRREGGMG